MNDINEKGADKSICGFEAQFTKQHAHSFYDRTANICVYLITVTTMNVPTIITFESYFSFITFHLSFITYQCIDQTYFQKHLTQ